MSRSPKFLAAHHLAARMLLNKTGIVLDADGALVRRTPLKQRTARKLAVLARLILDHRKVRLPDIEEQMFKEMMADRRYSGLVNRMQLRIELLGYHIRREWPSLCEHYEAEARGQITSLLICIQSVRRQYGNTVNNWTTALRE